MENTKGSKKAGMTLEALTSIGIALAATFISSDSQASMAKRGILLEMGEKYARDDSNAKAVLAGFEAGFVKGGFSESQARVRKSEARAVIEACSKTLLDGKNLAHLKAFKGGDYHTFIAEARKLRGTTERTSSSKVRKAVLTTIQQDKVELAIEKATPNQIVEINDKAIRTLHSSTQPAIAGYQSILMIQSICGQLMKRDDIEAPLKKAASEMDAIAGKVLEQARVASAATEKAISDSQGKSSNTGKLVPVEPASNTETEAATKEAA